MHYRQDTHPRVLLSSSGLHVRSGVSLSPTCLSENKRPGECNSHRHRLPSLAEPRWCGNVGRKRRTGAVSRRAEVVDWVVGVRLPPINTERQDEDKIRFLLFLSTLYSHIYCTSQNIFFLLYNCIAKFFAHFCGITTLFKNVCQEVKNFPKKYSFQLNAH